MPRSKFKFFFLFFSFFFFFFCFALLLICLFITLIWTLSYLIEHKYFSAEAHYLDAHFFNKFFKTDQDKYDQQALASILFWACK